MEDDTTRLRPAVSRVLQALRRGDEEIAVGRLVSLVEEDELALGGAVWELASANAAMLDGGVTGPIDDGVVGLIEPDGDGPGVPYETRLLDEDGEPIDIDSTEPALRAAVRILLAGVYGRLGDARLQVELVDRAGEPDDLTRVFLYTAGWTLEMIDAREVAGEPVPAWLRTT